MNLDIPSSDLSEGSNIQYGCLARLALELKRTNLRAI